jgi:hypothetical protein
MHIIFFIGKTCLGLNINSATHCLVQKEALSNLDVRRSRNLRVAGLEAAHANHHRFSTFGSVLLVSVFGFQIGRLIDAKGPSIDSQLGETAIVFIRLIEKKYVGDSCETHVTSWLLQQTPYVRLVSLRDSRCTM